jgi:hypothetical protein
MTNTLCLPERESFLRAAAFLSVTGGLALLPAAAATTEERPNVQGPRAGYAPQIGTLVSMSTWMWRAPLRRCEPPAQRDRGEGCAREPCSHLQKPTFSLLRCRQKSEG